MKVWSYIFAVVIANSLSAVRQLDLASNFGSSVAKRAFLIIFSIYEGKKYGANNEPIGSHVVKQAVDGCKWSNQHVILIIFFTFCNLIRVLADQKKSATYTIRKNRVDNCPFPSVEEMKKMVSGSYANKSDGKVELVRWNDYNVVTLCSKA